MRRWLRQSSVKILTESSSIKDSDSHVHPIFGKDVTRRRLFDYKETTGTGRNGSWFFNKHCL